MLNDAELLKLFLPELLIEHFEIVKVEEENKVLHIYFDEKIQLRKNFRLRYCSQKVLSRKLPLTIFLFVEKQ